MKKFKSLLLTFALMTGMAVPALAPVVAYAAPADDIKSGVTSVGGNANEGSKGFTDGLHTVVNLMMFLLGSIAVIMIIIGGIRYTTSNGDANTTKAAKDTIMYAVIGLVVAILAYAIVNFVISTFSSK